MKKIMKKIILVLGIIVMACSISGCQQVTKQFGGTSTIDLPAGKKLVPYTIQWEPKSSNIWYLTEDAEPGYTPKMYEFHESSNLGVAEGKIIFIEH